MAYRCSFMDNETYTAQDVNDIISRVTCGGVLFTDTGYTFGDLNSAVSSITTEGVTKDPDSCRVVKENSLYKISKGACIMNDGTAIMFDENGYEITPTEDQYNYVYLRRNSIGNTIDVVVSAYAGDEESIPLAEIDEKGLVHDRRIYAKAKVEVASGGVLRNFTARFVECTSSKSETVTFSFEDGDFSNIIVWDGERVSGNGTRQDRVANLRNLVPLVDGEVVSVSIGKRLGDHTEYIYCQKDGQNLYLYLGQPLDSAEYTLNLGVV